MTTLTQIPFQLAEPQVAGALAVYPVLGEPSDTAYRSLAEAVRLGAVVKEVDEMGSVGDVSIVNLTDQPLLVYEGEGIEGARQNRSFDSHVLVPAGVELTVPVCCVERARWEERQRAAHFRPAPHTSDPALRRTKRTRANESARSGPEARADQREVWSQVSARLAAHHVASPSAALSDVFRAQRPALEKLLGKISHVSGQVGAVAEIAGQPVALDLTSRPEVFAELLSRLASGYALQAIDAESATPSDDAALGFLQAALEAPRSWLSTPGMGGGFAISQRGIEGAGLSIGPELISLSAFPVDASRSPLRALRLGSLTDGTE